MALSRARRRAAPSGDYWPGFVDAMSTLLLVMTFLLSVFMLAQYFVTQEASGKDTALARLNRQIAELTELLALESSRKKSADDSVASLSATLAAEREEKRRLQGLIDLETGRQSAATGQVQALSGELDEQRKVSAEALARVELLNQQLAALRRQLAAIEAALQASEAKEVQSRERIADLGKRLNVALAQKVQELERFRSDFFGKLQSVLGARDEVRVVGDRFVFQAEVLFDSGSDEVLPEGRAQLAKLAGVLKELERDIPTEISWVLRIDGHTDVRPISSARFPSNWELSSARAISVVQFLIAQGVEPRRLVAAGFGENQPLAAGATDADLRRNRRIELKLTER